MNQCVKWRFFTNNDARQINFRVADNSPKSLSMNLTSRFGDQIHLVHYSENSQHLVGWHWRSGSEYLASLGWAVDLQIIALMPP